MNSDIAANQTKPIIIMSKKKSCIVNCIFGAMGTISLKNVEQRYGHDDSLPFQGDLYLNNVMIATCWNDGWGGETNIDAVNGSAAGTINIIDDYLRTNYKMHFKYDGKDHDFPVGLDYVIDVMANDALFGSGETTYQLEHMDLRRNAPLTQVNNQ